MAKDKGSDFERDICRKLSLWWTKGERDDIFWRTASSGALATIRKKNGKKTFGQSGDIQATDPIGQPLIDLFSIELKRGYSTDTFTNLLDKTAQSGVPVYELFFNQAIEGMRNSGAKAWMLIVKRDRRHVFVFIPKQLYNALKFIDINLRETSQSVFLIYTQKHKDNTKEKREIFGCTLDDFLAALTPSIVNQLLINLSTE